MASSEIAKEMIKPSSSPAPPHLRKLQLSFLDQLQRPIHIHIILYYQASHHHHDSGETGRKLKRSLSDALTIHYPLAGRIRENSWVDCNDAGAEYVEVSFNNVQLSDVVEKSGSEELKQYVPVEPSGGGDIPLAVQVSFFGCGGMSIGVCLSHRVADAMSLVTFINAWAAACQGDAKTIAVTQPTFGLASRFPPADFSEYFPSGTPPLPPPTPQKIVTKRFVFNKQKLAALRNAASGPMMEKPTRVEAVSAFIWRHVIKAARSKDKLNGEERVFTANHAVDIRPRASPPLPRQFFWNAIAQAMAMTTTAETEPDYYELATKLRDGIRKANADHITKLEDGDSFLKCVFLPPFEDGRKIPEMCVFTSWCRLPIYEVDYGWGKPVWVSSIALPYKNSIVFLGTKSGDGIEAWVHMLEEDMAIIENSTIF